MPDFYNWQADSLLLRVYIQPRASRDEIAAVHGDALKVRITAAPVDGKANAHLIRFLADTFKVPQSQVKLLKGQTSRTKQFSIAAPRQLPDLINPPA